MSLPQDPQPSAKRDRIKGNPRTGTGDLLHSSLITGYKLPKWNPICGFQNTLVLFRNYLALNKWLMRYHRLPFLNKYLKVKGVTREDLEFFDYLINEFCNNLAASTFFKYDNAYYTIPPDKLEYLERRLDEFTKAVPNASEFIIPVNPFTICADFMPTYARQVETEFAIVVHDIYAQHDRQTLDYADNPVIQSTGAFLNALSDYLWMFIRYYAFQNKDKETYWRH